MHASAFTKEENNMQEAELNTIQKNMEENRNVLFEKTLSFRWTDLDPNFHLRHSVYYDFGTQQRIEILEQLGLTLKLMQEQNFGPVIFREECVFKREIRFADTIRIRAKITKMKPDASRWTFQHEFLNADNKICAILTLEGAWFDTKLRKIAVPTPSIAVDILKHFPKSDDFSPF